MVDASGCAHPMQHASFTLFYGLVGKRRPRIRPGVGPSEANGIEDLIPKAVDEAMNRVPKQMSAVTFALERITVRQPFTRRRINVNSPYTKHLDAVDHSTAHSTALTVPTYAAAPMQAPAPVVVQSGGGDNGSKAGIVLVAVVLAIIGAAAGFAIAKAQAPSWNELRRFEALAGREGEVRGRDAGWNQGRKQGRTEMEFLAQYEKLRTQATAFSQGYRQGRSIGQTMGRDANRYRYGYGRGYGYGYGYGRGYRRGYGYGYGGRVGSAIASAQGIANMTGQPVDVIVGN